MNMPTLKVIPSAPDYYAGSDGVIYSTITATAYGTKPRQEPLPLKGWWSTGGYQSVSVGRQEARKTRTVHTLVAEAWHGPRPKGMDVSHIDDVCTNNRPENLVYESHSANLQRSDNVGKATASVCKYGHSRADRTKGQECRTCARDRMRAARS